MKRCIALIALVILFTTGSGASVARRNPPRDILGIRLRMNRVAATAALRRIARLERNERRRQEVWALNNNPRYSHLLIGYSTEGEVRYVTVVARQDGQRVRYRDVLDVERARQAGDPARSNYNYEWRVGARRNQPAYLVIARGRDADYLSLFSLKLLVNEEQEEDDDS